MCDYANYLERKARNEGISQGINQGKKIEFKEAVSLLEIPEKEIEEIEKYFQS